MSDNNKGSAYAVVAKDGQTSPNRQILMSESEMPEKITMDAYRGWVKTLKGKIPEVYNL